MTHTLLCRKTPQSPLSCFLLPSNQKNPNSLHLYFTPPSLVFRASMRLDSSHLLRSFPFSRGVFCLRFSTRVNQEASPFSLPVVRCATSRAPVRLIGVWYPWLGGLDRSFSPSWKQKCIVLSNTFPQIFSLCY